MIRVRLRDLVEAMEFQSDEMTAYYHRPTGRVLTVSQEAFLAAENDDDEGVTPEELAEAREILAQEDDYLELPDRIEIGEFRMMERFAGGVQDLRQQDELLGSLRGRGAFRRFKDAVYRFQLADEWYAFRDRNYEQLARDWCEANEIELDQR